jgi:transposase
MLAAPPEEGGAGGTSWSREIITIVQIWRPAGFFAVRNTNGRRGKTPVCNRVRDPDPTNMREVGMDGKGLRVIGIDVGKRNVDVAREGTRRGERHANGAAGIAKLVGSLDPMHDIVVFERSGGYERLLEADLAAAGVRWAVVHSRRVKAFREVQGIKAKSDAIDCRLLRDFGRNQLDAGKLRLGRFEDVTLAALVARRRQLEDMLHAERCRQETAAIERVRGSIARAITMLEAELTAIEGEIAEYIAADPELTLKEEVMCQRTGVGPTTARGLLAVLPQLGRATAKEIAALGGAAPRVHQSGVKQNRRGVERGRNAVKVILFNPARCAMRFDPEIKSFAERLRSRGKPGKVIMVAVMHKMLIKLNAAVRDALNRSEAAGAAA